MTEWSEEGIRERIRLLDEEIEANLEENRYSEAEIDSLISLAEDNGWSV